MRKEKNLFIDGVEFTPDRETLVRFPEDSAIRDCTVPPGTVEIGINAFFNCRQLHSITLPSSLNAIDGNAFQMCRNLSRLIIPGNVRTIAPDAFLGSESLDFTVDRFGALIYRRDTLLCIPSALKHYDCIRP